MTTRTAPRSGWDGFSLWAGAGVLVSLSLSAVASFGLLLAPFGGLAVGLLIRRGVAGPELLGLVSGAGVGLLGLAALNLGYEPCTGTTSMLASDEPSVGCGGWNPVPFAAAGAVLVVGAVVAFAALRRDR